METIILALYLTFAGNGLTGEMYMEISGFDTIEACEQTLEAYELSMQGDEVTSIDGVCATQTEA